MKKDEESKVVVLDFNSTRKQYQYDDDNKRLEKNKNAILLIVHNLPSNKKLCDCFVPVNQIK